PFRLGYVTVPFPFAPCGPGERRCHLARHRSRNRQCERQIRRRHAKSKGGQSRNDQTALARRTRDLVAAIRFIARAVLAAMPAGELDFPHDAEPDWFELPLDGIERGLRG